MLLLRFEGYLTVRWHPLAAEPKRCLLWREELSSEESTLQPQPHLMDYAVPTEHRPRDVRQACS